MRRVPVTSPRARVAARVLTVAILLVLLGVLLHGPVTSPSGATTRQRSSDVAGSVPGTLDSTDVGRARHAGVSVGGLLSRSIWRLPAPGDPGRLPLTVPETPEGPAPTPPPVSFPGPSSTGAPAGLALQPSGTITTSGDGQVIDSMDVAGSIRVEHNNVTVKRTRVRQPGGQAITMNPQKVNLVIEDCELDGTGNTDGSSAVGDVNFTMRRCNIHHFGEGPRINGNNVIEDNWFHDFLNFVAQGAHQDVVQITGGSNIIIRRNTMDMNVDGANAVIMMGTYQGSNILIENNLIAGGGYAVYGGSSNGYTNVRIVNNRFSTKYYPRGGFHGPFVYTEGAVVAGNVVHESGSPL